MSLSVTVVKRNDNERVKAVDASYRGLCLRSAHSMPQRQLLRLKVELPDREHPLDMHAVVMRSVQDSMGMWEIGLRFFALNGQEQVDWETFVAQRIYNRRAA